MSSYLKKYPNPKTGKHQVCYCIDDFYGGHKYGYGFPKDGSDADFDMFNEKFSFKEMCDVYTWDEVRAGIKTMEDVLLLFNNIFPDLYGNFDACDGWNPSVKEDVIDFINEYLEPRVFKNDN